MSKMQILAKAIKSLKNDDLVALSDLMHWPGLKLEGGPKEYEAEPDPESFVPHREINPDLLSEIQMTLKYCTRAELRELNEMLEPTGLRFLKVVMNVSYEEP